MAPSATVLAQDLFSRPLRIVTAQVGGGADFAARLVAQGLSAQIGQQIIVDNRPAGVIPGEIVSRAPPDGHTLLIAGNSLYLTPLLQSKVPYDAVHDFAPITAMVASPTFLVVHPSIAAKSARDLIALAKSRPGELNYSEGGTGGTPHLATELFKSMAGINLTRITYSGGGPALTAVIAGEVQVTFAAGGAVAPQMKAGKLKVLAVTSAKPSAIFPDVPALAATIPGYEVMQSIGIWAPARTPATVITRLNQEVVRAINIPDTRQKILNSGQEIVGNTSREFAAEIKAEITRMGKVIKDAGIRVD